MLWLRIVSAIIGIPLLLLIINVGGLWLALALFILIFIGTLEFIQMAKKQGFKLLIIPLSLGELYFILGTLFNSSYWFSIGLAISLFLMFSLLIIKFPEIKISDIAVNLFTLVYIGWSLTHILLISNLPKGNYLLLFLFSVIWATDTGAYFSGRFFGKKKLAPLISPNKTVAGAVGGLVVSAVIAIIFNYYFQLFSLLTTSMISLIISSMGQIGDLIESALKRLTGIKDSGNIIPGHGGILDRFDSIIIAAPVLFYLILFLDKMR